MPARYEVRQGVALALSPITLQDDQGDPITAYTGSEALSCTLWPGGNLPAACTPAVAWVSGPAGTLALTLTASQSAALAVGRYRGSVVLVDPVDGPLEAFAFLVEVTPAAGSAATGILYAGYGDLARYGRAWVRAILEADDDGGLAELAAASRRFDDLVIARYPTTSYAILGDPGYGSMAWGGSPGALPSQWLRGILAGGGLVVRPKVTEAVAKWALGDLAKGQVGTGETAAQFRRLGNRFENEGSAVALSMTAEVSTDGSGIPVLGIPLTGTSVRPWYS